MRTMLGLRRKYGDELLFLANPLKPQALVLARMTGARARGRAAPVHDRELGQAGRARALRAAHVARHARARAGGSPRLQRSGAREHAAGPCLGGKIVTIAAE